MSNLGIILAVINSAEIIYLCVLRLLWLTQNLIYGRAVKTWHAGWKREQSNPDPSETSGRFIHPRSDLVITDLVD